LYESMLVVWTSSTGPEILLRRFKEPLVVWLRWGPESEPSRPRRVVKARASDMIWFLG
jgi:hypothetical protein